MSDDTGRVGIAITETSEVDALWYVELADCAGNWLACLYKDAPEAPWRCTSRFRWYRDDVAWDSADVRSWVRAVAPDGSEASRARMFAVADELAHMIAEMYPGQLEHVPVHGGLEAFRAVFDQLSWTDSRTAWREE